MTKKSLGLIIFAILFVSSYFATSPFPTFNIRTQVAAISGSGSGLVAHYTFDDGTANDTSGNGNNGTVSGATAVAGKIGQGLSFDGSDDRISIPASSSLNNLSSLTISFWAKPSSIGGNRPYVSKSDNSAGGHGWRVGMDPASGGRLSFIVDGFTTSDLSVSGNSAFSAGELAHYTVTWDGSNQASGVRLYKNGSELSYAVQANGGSASPQSDSSRPVSIGRESGVGSNYIDGMLDDVRIYNRVLSASEIGEIYSYVGGGSSEPPPANEPTPDPAPEDEPTPAPPPPSDLSSVKNWYVDKNAGGAGDGTSWASAWNELDKINWANVTPGDTIHISGGSGGLTYTSKLTVGKAGTASEPITIKTSQEAGKNGLVTILNNVSISYNWVTLNGAKSGSFSTNIKTKDVRKIIENINLVISNPTGVSLSIRGHEGNKVFWTRIENSGSNSTAKGMHGIQHSYSAPSGTIVRNSEIAYVWVRRNKGDGINFASNAPVPEFGGMKIHHVISEENGDDNIQAAGGTDISYSFVGRTHPTHKEGHPDTIQIAGSRHRIYNNEMVAVSNSVIYSETRPFTDAYILVYGNSAWTESVRPPYGLSFGMQWFTGDSTNSTWNNLVVAGNTITGVAQQGIILWNSASLERLDIKNSYVINNLIWDVTKSSQPNAGTGYMSRGTGGRMYYSTSDLKVSHNLISGNTDNFYYNDVLYDTASSFNQATGFAGNNNLIPVFTNISANNLRLTSTDAAARNKGAALNSQIPSSILSLMPDYNIDMDGNYRGSDGTWDIGAYEYNAGGDNTPYVPPTDPDPEPEPETPPDTTLGLVGKWDFNTDNFSTTRNDTHKTTPFTDSSSTGNTADCQSAFALNGTTYNQCPIETTGPDGSKAAQFRTNSVTCDIAADYIAIPRNSKINSLSKGTLGIWIAPASVSDVTHRIIDSYRAGIPGTWQIHRDSDRYYTFTVNTNNGAPLDAFTFPGIGTTAGTWTHYAVTWDGTNFRGYYNGVLFGTFPMSGVSSLDLSYYIGLGALIHNNLRNTPDGGNCVKLYSAPAGDYVFPNAGFFSGKMDDFRIYDRALSESEVAQIASKTNTPYSGYILRTSKAGTGSGSISGSGISCGKHCAESFNSNTTVTLTATPSADSVFSGWSGSCSGTGSCSVSMNNHKTVVANFSRAYSTAASLSAPSGNIQSPFTVSDGAIYQPQQAPSIGEAGKASYTFNISEAGEYILSFFVNSPSLSSNSMYVNIDAEPTTDMAWHMNTTGGFEQRIVSWGGSASGGNPPKVFNLTSGTHTLIVRGREANVHFKTIDILKKGTGAIEQPVVEDPPPTLDTTGPSLTEIKVTAITKNGATITWKTDESSTAQVQYGTSAYYGQSSPLDPVLLRNHSITLSSLSPNTTYHYRVISKDGSGNTTTSGDGVFSTLEEAQIPIQTPDPQQPEQPLPTPTPPLNKPPQDVIVTKPKTTTPSYSSPRTSSYTPTRGNPLPEEVTSLPVGDDSPFVFSERKSFWQMIREFISGFFSTFKLRLTNFR